MKAFLHFLLIEPFEDRCFGGYVFGFLMWLLLAFLLVVAIGLSLAVVDTAYLPTKESDGVVIGHYYRPQYVYTSYIMVGKVMMPMTHVHKDEYGLIVSIEGQNGSIEVTHSDWNKIKDGNQLNCEYGIGRVYREVEIKSISTK
tara:strand:+ start:3113 stop:3541 length:429 start_codon:yes stop_codon:yes gene_type:complete